MKKYKDVDWTSDELDVEKVYHTKYKREFELVEYGHYNQRGRIKVKLKDNNGNTFYAMAKDCLKVN